jgi:subtilisin family serine protease
MPEASKDAERTVDAAREQAGGVRAQADNRGVEAQARGATASPQTIVANDHPAPDASGVRLVGPRPPQYMIATRPAPGLQPLSVDVVAEQLRRAPDIEFVRTIEPPRLLASQELGLLNLGGEEEPPIGTLVLARMAQEKAARLQEQASARLVVERDLPLTFSAEMSGPMPLALQNPGLVVPHSDGFSATIEVQGEDGQPLRGAEVYVFGSVWPAQGVTDEAGRASIAVPGESPDTIHALYVKPKADYWSLWLPRPRLAPDLRNNVRVRSLGDNLQGFPDEQLTGWGLRAMGIHRLPRGYDGAGVRIAVIDSGAAQPTHRNLHNVGPGVDVVGGSKDGWTDDKAGHGSHCAGIIGGGPAGGGTGIRGIAPAAEIHVCRIFPGGRFSDLVAALDYCLEQGIDVVNLSLGGGQPSRIVEERIQRAKAMGIACIVAAGNSGGAVQFPASTPHVLAVGAIGRWGEFPEDSYHATQVLDSFDPTSTPEGYFPTRFGCFGPELDVCAPGVAIVSSLPPDGFAAWDGTSMATPHVTGLAALVLAHHPDFLGAFRARDARRVERLFQIIKETAMPLGFGDAARTGAGLPYAPRALGLESGVLEANADGAVSEQTLRSLLSALGKVRISDRMSDQPPSRPFDYLGGLRPQSFDSGKRWSRQPPVGSKAWQALHPGAKAYTSLRGPARTAATPPMSLQSTGPVLPITGVSGTRGASLEEMRAVMMRAGLL